MDQSVGFSFSLNVIDNNPIDNQARHKDLCTFLYSKISSVNLGDNRFRLTCNYLNITDAELQQIKDTFDYNSFDRTPGTLYKITE